MKANLDEIPLGTRRLEIGLILRESWFLNGTLYNSEVWCSYLKKDLKVLELLDKKILRLILGAHSKIPCEMLYLESGALPPQHVITVRRLSYLQTILKRHDTEIIRKVYSAQKRNPCKGDWIKLVETDMKQIELNIEDEHIEQINENDFKKVIQSKVRQQAFKELKLMQDKHKKVKQIPFVSLGDPQLYLKHKYFSNKKSSLLFNLRCQTVRNVRYNFHTYYNNDILCKLGCTQEIDSQEHMLSRRRVISQLAKEDKELLKTVQYKDIFGEPEEQYHITRVFKSIIKIR